ncbi:type V toxin-antitoxin system endoribonuclease antitoxin GhoS [Xenorhabdus nematophila]|uniref:Uncharacterized protein n=1 Tax=Xenorhabdus nematophila (strain ATCC 19061 / DSM 3370 / CCUG 14189 / LMG 1036 / NCIMB 9965 / AN6) TaxID=406817 RepID=D3VFE7_XENNA|nr:type V toxin-antitoxin system endoribonuclease antitoxin GhoS [Xenorhabdus nematophila]CEE93268.1 conserved hypothetical protein [Xenorhabdus nematophila str. Anatoliense]CEF31927.1 conserved hypothetical protein [Xenorhabdus nematophila str. Websteri]AYA40261.1 endoribonuclease GhoS [Xenorhabdus nematophila]KHD29051.1 hypothetical protein LH67_05370 [Xenorhabdus nematophila]MBA0018930.1 type V toxin-antitoxin system endoribonuclease antitoxin GhoS [Xenorhabdus nematophila]
MASYLIRVELYGTGSDGYEKLHKRMTANQFSQSIRFPNGKWHRLPSGTYIGSSSLESIELAGKIKSMATPFSNRDPSIFVCTYSNWSASLYPEKQHTESGSGE